MVEDRKWAGDSILLFSSGLALRNTDVQAPRPWEEPVSAFSYFNKAELMPFPPPTSLQHLAQSQRTEGAQRESQEEKHNDSPEGDQRMKHVGAEVTWVKRFVHKHVDLSPINNIHIKKLGGLEHAL